MSQITTHILDASKGRPAREITVILKQVTKSSSTVIDEKRTDSDGRIKNFAIDTLMTGDYQLEFHVGEYLKQTHGESFYPKVCIEFHVADTTQHYHVPLLISPYSYSTYRGS